jgi:hypothetical protein
MSPHSLTLYNASKTCKEWNYSANSMYVGDTTISESAKQINGRAHLKCAEDFMKQK